MTRDYNATVPCDTCGTPTRMAGTRRCDGCWEVEHRLDDYLRSEGGRRHVAQLLGVDDLEARLARERERADALELRLSVNQRTIDRCARDLLMVPWTDGLDRAGHLAEPAPEPGEVEVTLPVVPDQGGEP